MEAEVRAQSGGETCRLEVDAVLSKPQARGKWFPKRQRSDVFLAHLTHTIEVDIVPRLVKAHKRPARALAEPKAERGDAHTEFAEIVCHGELPDASAYVGERRACGESLEAIYLDLLAPTARTLGEMWEADLCDFTQVTLALWRLQQVLHQLRPEFQDEGRNDISDRQALLVPVFGEQHTFGLSMVTDFFRRAGWNVWSTPLAARSELVQIVSSEWFAVVGLSLSSEIHLDELTGHIRTIRRSSRNADVVVMVGGPVFTANPDFVGRVGADLTASDVRLAPLQAQELVESAARR
jgi:MerR family transcriptional regulator, light-induced transcriptional regulator